MTMQIPATDLVILAGGQARRMNGMNKLLQQFDDQIQLSKICQKFKSVFLCIPSWRIFCNNLYKNRTNQIYNRITYDYKFHRISCQPICLTTINGLG